jgi:response regulator RpfG family c-di-GMP phosphodiesterase
MMWLRDRRLQVLFVDDEPSALAALRRRLRPYRAQWDIAYVQDSLQALELGQTSCVDVVVVDLHMPGLRGDELLERFRILSPSTVRILASAEVDLEVILRASWRAHRFIAKPCQPDEIEATIRSAAEMRAHLHGSPYAAALGSVKKGPLLPSVYGELVDPVRELLRGSDLRATAVIAAKIFEQLRVGTTQGMDTNEAWQRGAAAAERVARFCAIEPVPALVRCQAAIAAHMCEIGPLLVARYATSSRSPETESRLAADALAAYALGLWGFGDPVLEAVAFQTAPGRAPASAGISPLLIAHVALAALDGKQPDADYLQRRGLAERAPAWLEACGGAP